MGKSAEKSEENIRPEYNANHITGTEWGVFSPDNQLMQCGDKMECQIMASRLNYAVTLGINYGMEEARS